MVIVLRKSPFTPSEDDFAGLAGFHQFDRVLELSVGKVVSDDRSDIDAALD